MNWKVSKTEWKWLVRLWIAGAVLIPLAGLTGWVLGTMNVRRWVEAYERGKSLVQSGQYAEAEETLEESLRLAEKRVAGPHLDTLNNLYDLGVAYFQQKKLAEAENMFLRALDMASEMFGPNDSYVVGCLDYLSDIYYTQERFADDISVTKRLLAIRERTVDPEDVTVGALLYNLGWDYCSLDPPAHFDEAKSCLLRAIRIQERTLPSDDPALADTRDQLRRLYVAQARLKEAEERSNRPD